MNLKNKQLYFELGNQLPQIYKHLNLDNHCYWRIALDNTLSTKWRDVVTSPAYKNISEEQLNHVIHLLERYKDDERLLLEHNRVSLAYRLSK